MSLSSVTSISIMTPIESPNFLEVSHHRTTNQVRKLDGRTENQTVFSAENIHNSNCLDHPSEPRSSDFILVMGNSNVRTLYADDDIQDYELGENINFEIDCGDVEIEQIIHIPGHINDNAGYSVIRANTIDKSEHNSHAIDMSSSDVNLSEDCSRNAACTATYGTTATAGDIGQEFDANINKDGCFLEEICGQENSTILSAGSNEKVVHSNTKQRLACSMQSSYAEISPTTNHKSRINQSHSMPDFSTRMTKLIMESIPRRRNSLESVPFHNSYCKKQETNVEEMQNNNDNKVILNSLGKSYFATPGHFATSGNHLLKSRLFKTVTNGLKSTETNSDVRLSNVENRFTSNKSTTNVNISNSQHAIHMNENANTDTAPFPLKQTVAYANCGSNSESESIISKSLLTDLQYGRVSLQSRYNACNATAQYCAVSGGRSQQQDELEYSIKINTACKVLNNGIAEQRECISSILNKTTNRNTSDITIVKVLKSRGQTLSMDIRKNIKASIDKNVYRKRSCVESRKKDKYFQNDHKKRNVIVDGRNIKNRKISVDSNINNSQNVFHKSQKTQHFNKNAVNICQKTATKKALDDLHAGPYSEALSYISSEQKLKKTQEVIQAKRRSMKINQRSNQRYQRVTVTADSKYGKMKPNRDTDSYSKITMTKSQDISSNSERPFIDKYLQRQINNKNSCCQGKMSTARGVMHRQRKHVRTLTESKQLSLHSEKESQIQELCIVADVRDCRMVLPAISSSENITSAVIKSRTLHQNSVIDLEHTHKEDYDTSNRNTNTEIQMNEDTASTNQKKHEENELQFSYNNIDGQKEDKDVHDKNKDIIEEGDIGKSLSELFKIKEMIETSSTELTNDKTEEGNVKDPIELSNEQVDTNSIYITPTRDSHSFVRSDIKKFEEPQATVDSSAVLTMSDDNQVPVNTSSIKQLVFNNLQQTIETKNKFSPKNVHVNSSDDVPYFGSSINNEGAVRISGKLSIWPSSGIQQNSSNQIAPLEEDSMSFDSCRNSRSQSIDSVFRKSVEYRIRNPTLVIQPHGDKEAATVLTKDESFIQSAIPLLPLSSAVFCLILNICLPGSGTVLSGFLVLCGGQSRVSKKDDQIFTTMCVNCMVGLAQLFTVTFLLVGWFWSVSWGVKMVLLSAHHHKEESEQKTMKLQTFAVNAFESHTIFGSQQK